MPWDGLVPVLQSRMKKQFTEDSYLALFVQQRSKEKLSWFDPFRWPYANLWKWRSEEKLRWFNALRWPCTSLAKQNEEAVHWRFISRPVCTAEKQGKTKLIWCLQMALCKFVKVEKWGETKMIQCLEMALYQSCKAEWRSSSLKIHISPCLYSREARKN